MTQLKLAVIGVQHPHVDLVLDAASRRSDAVRLVGLAERDPRLRDDYARKLGIPGMEGHRRLLDEAAPDAAVIAAANHERAAIAADCLRAGAHVILDKPICTTVAQLDELETAWRESGRHLHCLFEKRMWPDARRAREGLAGGGLGRLISVVAAAPHCLGRSERPAWMFSRASYGGIINDLAIHDIDLFLDFTGATSGWVQAWTRNHAHPEHPEFEDHGLVLIRTDCGRWGSLEVDWFGADPRGPDAYRVALSGTSGRLDLDFADRGGPGGAADDFLDAVLNGSRPQITAEQVLGASRIAVTAQAHANDGLWHRWRLNS